MTSATDSADTAIGPASPWKRQNHGSCLITAWLRLGRSLHIESRIHAPPCGKSGRFVLVTRARYAGHTATRVRRPFHLLEAAIEQLGQSIEPLAGFKGGACDSGSATDPGKATGGSRISAAALRSANVSGSRGAVLRTPRGDSGLAGLCSSKWAGEPR